MFTPFQPFRRDDTDTLPGDGRIFVPGIITIHVANNTNHEVYAAYQ